MIKPIQSIGSDLDFPRSQSERSSSVERLILGDFPGNQVDRKTEQAEVERLRRMLKTRMAELESTDPHIAKLETEILELRDAVRDRKRVKKEYDVLRQSAEYRIGRVLFAPYRLLRSALAHIGRSFLTSEKLGEETRRGDQYRAWFEEQSATTEQLRAMRAEAKEFAFCPMITIAIPMMERPARFRQAIESVLQQAYENWELLIVDASARDVELTDASAMAARDSRVVLRSLDSSPSLHAAIDYAFAHAQGDWVGLLHPSDSLEPDALYHMVKKMQEFPEANILYSDEDTLTEGGLESPSFKPDWSPDLLLSYNYISHLALLRRELVKRIGGVRAAFHGALEYDLILRATEQTDRIHHIPRVLYHGCRGAQQPGLLDAGRRALEEHLVRTNELGTVSNCITTDSYRVRREIKKHERICIIIPTRDRIDLLSRCVDTVQNKTDYPNYEIVIVNNDSRSKEASSYFEKSQHRVLSYEGPFNYSAINNFAVEQTDSPWLLFLNNDTEVLHKDWLTAMAEHVQRPEVGAVGARLVYKDDKVQHAGVVLGVGGLAAHAFRDFRAGDTDTSRQLQVIRNYSAVTAACLLTRRDVFEQCGCFDEERVPVSFSEVDLCLRMQRTGYLIVYTPFATLFHYESATRRRSPEPIESDVIRQRWPDAIKNDRYYNPNLSRKRADFSLAV